MGSTLVSRQGMASKSVARMRNLLMSAHDQSFFSNVIRYFDQAAAFTQHPSGLLDQIKRCNSVYRFEFPLSRPGGDVEVIQAWRVEHSHHKLPVKGGIRYSPDANERDAGHPRCLCQCGWRNRLIFRMAEEPLTRPLRANGETLRGIGLPPDAESGGVVHKPSVHGTRTGLDHARSERTGHRQLRFGGDYGGRISRNPGDAATIRGDAKPARRRVLQRH